MGDYTNKRFRKNPDGPEMALIVYRGAELDLRATKQVRDVVDASLCKQDYKSGTEVRVNVRRNGSEYVLSAMAKEPGCEPLPMFDLSMPVGGCEPHEWAGHLEDLRTGELKPVPDPRGWPRRPGRN